MAMFTNDTCTDSEFSLDSIDTPQSRRVESTVVVDLRGSPRIEVTFPAEIHPQGGQRVLAMVTNISRSGLRVEGGSNLVEALFGGEVLQDNHASVAAEFSFRVPGDNESELPVVVYGRSVYARQDGGGYQIGVEFREFIEGRRVLYDYLASRGVRQ